MALAQALAPLAASSGIDVMKDNTSLTGGAFQGLKDVEDMLYNLEFAIPRLETDCRHADKVAAVAGATKAQADSKVEAIDIEIAQLDEAYKVAQQNVAALTKTQLNEVKALKTNPPAVIRRAMEALWIVMNYSKLPSDDRALRAMDLSKEWTKIQKMLTADDFVSAVASFDVTQLDNFPWVPDFVVSRYFPEMLSSVASSYSAAVSLTMSASGSKPQSPKTVTTTDGSEGQAGGSRPSSAASGGGLGCSGRDGAASNKLPSLSQSSSRGSLSKALDSRASLNRTAPTALSPKARSTVSLRSDKRASAVAPAEVQQLDLETVERASKACGVLVKWCMLVIQEFLSQRLLRVQRDESCAVADSVGKEAAARSEEADACEAKLKAALAERDSLRECLANLREQADAAERALKQLEKLEKLDFSIPDGLRIDAHIYGEPKGTKPPSPAGPPPPQRSPPRPTIGTKGPPMLGNLMRLVREANMSKEDKEEERAIIVEHVSPSKLPSRKGALAGLPVNYERKGEPQVLARPKWETQNLDQEEELGPDPVIEVEQPPPLPAVKRPFAAIEEHAETAAWWLACGPNEPDVCDRGSAYYREQIAACKKLLQYMEENQTVVVVLDGRTSGKDEDPDICDRRARSVAAWLESKGISRDRYRFDIPLPAPSRKEAGGGIGGQSKPSEETEESAPPDANGNDEDEEEEEDEEDEEEEEEEDDGLPERGVTARCLREIRTVEGPRAKGFEESDPLGIYFAPEDFALDSLGSAALRILEKYVELLEQLWIDEGPKLILVEGHSDEGIQAESLLEWLSINRARSVQKYLLDRFGREQNAAAEAEAAEAFAAAEAAAEGSSAEAAEAAEAFAAAEAAAEAAGEATAPEKATKSFLQLEGRDVCVRSRSNKYKVNEEWGRSYVNRRVQVFII